MFESHARFSKGASLLLSGALVVSLAPALAAPQASWADAPASTPATATAQTAVPTAGGELDSGSYRLDADVAGTITVKEGATVTLDLNGHGVLPAKGDAIVNHGTLDITGSGEVAAKGAGAAALANLPGATCTIDGGTYSSEKWYVIKNLGTLTIEGADAVKGTDGNPSSLIDNGWYGGTDTVAGAQWPAASRPGAPTLTINGGGFDGTAGNKSCSIVKNDDYGVLAINGGVFDSSSDKGQPTGTPNNATILNWNRATINDGTFKGPLVIVNASTDVGDSNSGYEDGDLTINGGTFETSASTIFGYAPGAKMGKGSVTINGGGFGEDVMAEDLLGYYPIEVTGGTFAEDVSQLVPGSMRAELPQAKVTGKGRTSYAYGLAAIQDAASSLSNTVEITNGSVTLANANATVKNSAANTGTVTVNGQRVEAGKVSTATASSEVKGLEDEVSGLSGELSEAEAELERAKAAAAGAEQKEEAEAQADAERLAAAQERVNALQERLTSAQSQLDQLKEKERAAEQEAGKAEAAERSYFRSLRMEGFKAAAKRGRKAGLSWKAPKGVSGLKYQVRYRKAGSKKWTVKKSAKTRLTVGKLKAGARYVFEVRGYKKVAGKLTRTDWAKAARVLARK